jgi:hypothetical protein
MRLIAKLSFALSLISITTQTIAAECSAKSGASTVPLLELYTSEGCSSCPPADKWLSGLTLDTKTIVPLAFHVDYWDYIGWKDKFSKAEYSERQRKTAAFAGASFVYTPQFVFNGRDFRGADDSRLKQAISASQKIAARAHLSLNAISLANGEISLQATATGVNAADSQYAQVFVAIYENKLVSQIKAGENNGRELKHDYVVRDFYGAYPIDRQNAFAKNIQLKPEWKSRAAGAVLFVQDARNGEILQSLQLPFCS